MARRVVTYDVFVGNLPPDANEKNVGKLFVAYGEIQGIIVKDSNKTANSKIAFVKYLCEPDADKAVGEMNNMEIEGRSIVVRRSDSFPKKKGGDGDRGAGQKKKLNGFQKGDRTPDLTEDRSGGHFGSYEPQGEVVPEPSSFTTPTKRPHMAELFANELDSGAAKFLKETAMITHVESPVTLWLQIVNEENTKRIFHITEQLAALCPSARKITSHPDPGKVYACSFSEDMVWYRCVVRQTLGTDKYKIQYIDYGNTEEVSTGSLVEIPQSISAPKGLAQKIVLHNTIAKDLSDKLGIQLLKQLTDGQMIQLIKTRSLSDGSGYYGHVLVNGQSVADSIIQAGYAVKRPGLGGKTQQHQPILGGGGDASGHHPPLIPTTPVQSEKQMPVNHSVSPLLPLHVQGDSREKELLAELTKKRRELERVRNEKDSARMELEYMKSKMKTLKEECSAEQAKMSEETLSKRFNSVIALASTVRHLREQFPTNKHCVLEEAISLSRSTDRVENSSVASLQAVSSCLAVYQAAQKEISSCKEPGELLSLVKARDSSRKDLHEKLTVCLEDLDKMPLSNRTKAVQETELQLVHIYGPYLKFHVHDCPNIENLVAGFTSWKLKKDREFADVRTATDFSEEAVQTVLQQMKELLSVDKPTAGQKSDVDIDGLMKTYAHALQREINVTDMEHGKDASLVATVVASVRRELNTEYTMLHNFNQMKSEFSTLRKTIEPWLTETPTLTELQEVKKTLRTLRSKLRHKLADKQDIEESGSESELESIKQEEEEIRSQLQAVLTKSDALLAEAASFAEALFPEFLLQFSDIGLDVQLQYDGLVKVNREIDHYTLTPGYRADLYKTTFDGQAVMIQEFHIGDSEHCSKEDFMKQVTSYHKEMHSVQAVFFSKNERLAYVQSKWIEGSLLESAVKQHTLTPVEIQQISRDIVILVSGLHGWGCVHGEVTPQSVLLEKDACSVVLLPPDFSRTVADRCSKKYTTENGLTFNLLEQQLVNQEPLGISSELYNVALLIFWLHNLGMKVPLHANGLPDIRSVKLDPSLKMMCDTLLHVNTTNRMRIAAAQILQLDYFTKPVKCPSPRPITVSPKPVKTPEPLPVAVQSESPITSVTVSSATPVMSAVPVLSPAPDAMEIGVFKVEDNRGQEEVIGMFDSDDSWTTKSSSTTGSTNSRTDSPLIEAAIEESKIEKSVASDAVETVVESESNSGQATTISGKSSDFGGGDIFSQAVNSPFLVDGEDEAMPVLETFSEVPVTNSLKTNIPTECSQSEGINFKPEFVTPQADDIERTVQADNIESTVQGVNYNGEAMNSSTKDGTSDTGSLEGSEQVLNSEEKSSV